MAATSTKALVKSLCVSMALLATTARAADDQAEWAYRIAPGDTLISLSEAYLQPQPGWRGLQQLNKVADPRRLVPGSTLRIPVAWLRSESTLAEIVHVHGEPELRQPGERTGSPARVGQRLSAGTLLRTGPQSSLVLRFADGSRMMVATDTQLTLDKLLSYGRSGLQRTQLRLDGGSVESQVVPARTPYRHFEITTPVATLGVRGTEFRAHAGMDSAGVEVLQGAVGAEAGRELRVDAGYGTVADAKNGVAPPVELLPAPGLQATPAAYAGTPLPLRWNAVPGAQAYRAQVLDASGALWLDRRVAAATTTDWDASATGRFQWRVRAIDARGIEGFDAMASVDVAAAAPPLPPGPPAPRDPQPTSGARVSGASVSFSWLAVEAGRRYRLQVALQPDFGAPVVDITDDQPTQLSLVQRRVMLAPGRYHWRVASVSPEGVSGDFRAGGQIEVVAPAP